MLDELLSDARDAHARCRGGCLEAEVRGGEGPPGVHLDNRLGSHRVALWESSLEVLQGTRSEAHLRSRAE